MEQSLHEKIFVLRERGLCCSQIVTQLAGLEPQEREGGVLIKALSGLGRGFGCQGTCGALTGAACAFGLCGMEKQELRATCAEFAAWFRETFGDTDCLGLVGENGQDDELCFGRIVRLSIERCLQVQRQKNLPKKK